MHMQAVRRHLYTIAHFVEVAYIGSAAMPCFKSQQRRRTLSIVSSLLRQTAAGLVVVLLLYMYTVCARSRAVDLEDGDENVPSKRALTLNTEIQKWPDGIIPYRLDFQSEFTDEEEAYYTKNIVEAMEWWENSTCVQFYDVRMGVLHSYEGMLNIRIKEGRLRCSAYLGYSELQYVFLDETCLDSVGDIAHELGHTLGFLDEHTRNDRDQFIDVNFNNLNSENGKRYEKQCNCYAYQNTPYDLGSIMHYPLKNGDAKNLSIPVMSLKENISYNGTIGQRECLSYYDVRAANLLYNCSLSTTLPEVTSCNYKELPFLSDSSYTLRPMSNDCLCSVTPTATVPAKIYPGDVLAFKGDLTPLNRWMGCPKNGKCFAWSCPGARFYPNTENRCHHFKFVASPVNPDSSPWTELRSGDRIVLQQLNTMLNDIFYAPLQCGENGEQCAISDAAPCRSTNQSVSSHCIHCHQQVFRLVARDKERGVYLEHLDLVVLAEDTDAGELTLACYAERTRKFQRTCQLQMCDSVEEDCTNHFILYKL